LAAIAVVGIPHTTLVQVPLTLSLKLAHVSKTWVSGSRTSTEMIFGIFSKVGLGVGAAVGGGEVGP